jgi:hypothetical protein
MDGRRPVIMLGQNPAAGVRLRSQPLSAGWQTSNASAFLCRRYKSSRLFAQSRAGTRILHLALPPSMKRLLGETREFDLLQLTGNGIGAIAKPLAVVELIFSESATV